MPPDYLLLGHITADLFPGGMLPGGTALYSALTAYRLGQRVAVVTAPAHLPADWPAAITIAELASTTAPTFENRYTTAGRTQILHAEAASINLASIPENWRAASIVHLGPVTHEIPEALVFAFPQALIGVTPQGWMRTWQPPLPATIHYTPWKPTPPLLARIDALVLSIEDVRGDLAQVQAYAAACRLVVLTDGAAGATLFVDGVPSAVRPSPAIERDPTGAGDVFAATLFCALRAGKPPQQAAAEAAYVAAASVESIGASGLLSMVLA